MMEEIHLLGGNHSSTLSGSGFQLPKNYSQLLNKLEQLALGLESTFANLSIDHKALEISLNAHNGSNGTTLKTDLSEDIFVTSTGQGGLTQHNGRITSHQLADEINYSRFFSDIWVGVILTLLIVSVIFFICAGFLLHKFQQWKTSYRANPEMDICRHCPGRDFEAESLPSYTIVSGLPTYDDALEEFRKAGIILTPPRVPVIKIFDANGDNKDGQIFNNFDSSINDLTVTSRTSADAISMTSICTCGANNNNNNNNNNISNTSVNSNVITAITPPGTPIPVKHMPGNTQVIELSPDQLAQFSHKRLSLQITFNNSIRRPSRPRVDLYRAANRNNFLRLQAINNAASNPPSPTNSPSCSNANNKNINPFFPNPFPTIHRSTSSGSLINHQQHQQQQQQQQQSQQQQQQPQQQQQQQQQQTDCITNNMRLQHRGSLT